MAAAEQQVERAGRVIGEEFVGLDPGTIGVVLGGVMAGFFSSELIAEFIGGNVENPRRRVAAELVSKLTLGALELGGWMRWSGALSLFLLFAALGSLASFGLDLLTIAINMAQGEGMTGVARDIDEARDRLRDSGDHADADADTSPAAGRGPSPSDEIDSAYGVTA